jgi:cytochrome c oxidase cbb3-type subunit 3/ubiquinol-cytochrome c reductase cytochrome c subunit
MKKAYRGGWRLLPLLAMLATGCDLPGKPREADRPQRADRVMDFGDLYRERCAGCHGKDGKLGPAPPLNDAIFLAIVPDDELFRVIYEGRAVTATQMSPMPAFGATRGAPLTDAELKALADLKEERPAAVRQQGPLTDAQVKVLAEGMKKRWGQPVTGPLPPYLSPPGSKRGNGKEGARVFARACEGCHGPGGQGEKDGKPLDGGAINNPAFLALVSDKALRRYIITGRPDLGMPPYNGKGEKAGRTDDFVPLTSADIDDLVALLKSWRAGEHDNKME